MTGSAPRLCSNKTPVSELFQHTFYSSCAAAHRQCGNQLFPPPQKKGILSRQMPWHPRRVKSAPHCWQEQFLKAELVAVSRSTALSRHLPNSSQTQWLPSLSRGIFMALGVWPRATRTRVWSRPRVQPAKFHLYQRTVIIAHSIYPPPS